MRTRFDRIYVNWIFGKKALKRWNERTEEQIYYANRFKLILGIQKKLEKLSSVEYMNQERNRFNNNSRQLIHCNELSLFDDKSAVCINCVFFISCKNGM
jgi:hypothetical protein